MRMPISFNGNLAGHLGLGQHCNVNVMQPISRIVVGNGLIAAATTCVKSAAAKSLILSTPTICQYLTTQKKKRNKRGSKEEHVEKMEKRTPFARRCDTRAPQKGTGVMPTDAGAILFAHGE